MKIRFNKILWGYAFFVIGLVYIFGLFIDLTGDSGLYATISRQMVESADWFNLKINGDPYNQKPHLFFWLAGFGIQLFGNTNFAFKIFPFLYGLLGIYFTYRLGKQLFSKEAGKLAALLTGTSQISFLYFSDFHTDTVLQTGVVLALWQLAAYLQNRKLVNFILGFFGIGLAMLSKGPIGAVLPFFAVLLLLIAKRDFKQLFQLKWLLGILIVLVVISPSLFYLYNNFGFEGLKFYFITNNIGRITGEYAGSNSDPFYYLYNALWAFLPWTIFVLASFVFEIKSWVVKSKTNFWGIYLLGSVFFLIFILSIAKGKAPNYFLITVSPVSIVAGMWLSRFHEFKIKKQKFIIRLQIVLLFFLGIFFIYVAFVFGGNKTWIPIILLVFLLGSIMFSIRIKEDPVKKIVLISVFVSGFISLFLNVKVLPELFSYQGARQVLEIFNREGKQENRLYNFELEEYEMFFYAKDSVGHINNWEELYEVFEKPGTWVYTNPVKYNDILKMKFEFDTIYEIRQRGMNRIIIDFLNPATRENTLKTNYLFVTSQENQKGNSE